MYDRATIKDRSRAVLREYRGPSIGVYVLYAVLIAVVTGATFGFGDFFLVPPLFVGLTMFYLHVWRRQQPQFETLFAGFYRYTQSLVGILWMYLWTFLWSLLFIIPGIVKGLAYSMTPYLLSDYPDIDPRHALRVSMKITDDHKAEIFVMQLSFIGWHMLSAFTLGILQIVFVAPYQQIAMAGLYEQLLAEALEEGDITEADLHRQAWVD